MNGPERRAALLAQALRELSELVDDMGAKADHLHALGDRGEWPHDLDSYAARVASTRDYLRGLDS